LRRLPVFSAPIPALHMRDAKKNIPKKEGLLFAAVTARSYRVCFLFGGRDWLLGGSKRTGASRNDLIYTYRLGQVYDNRAEEKSQP
jgi:hypothetical protein